jgi:uncharacterized protein (DUF433 family)
MKIDWSECPAVERHPNRMSGAWTFSGTRVPVTFLFENLDAGATVAEFVDWFEGVTEEQVHQVLNFVARSSEQLAAA